MLIFKKEKQARKLVLEHFAKTHDCLIEAHNAIEVYVAGDQDAVNEVVARVIELESEADSLKREVRKVLFSGAFLPHIRSDIYRLVESVDAIADKGESASRFMANQTPRLLDGIGVELIAVFDLCLECYAALREALKCFFKPKGEFENLQTHTTRVGDLETEVDKMEAELTRRIFNSTMGTGEKLHLCQLLRYIADIADSAEDTADELEFAAMKSVV